LNDSICGFGSSVGLDSGRKLDLQVIGKLGVSISLCDGGSSISGRNAGFLCKLSNFESDFSLEILISADD